MNQMVKGRRKMNGYGSVRSANEINVQTPDITHTHTHTTHNKINNKNKNWNEAYADGWDVQRATYSRKYRCSRSEHTQKITYRFVVCVGYIEQNERNITENTRNKQSYKLQCETWKCKFEKFLYEFHVFATFSSIR